MRSVTFAKGLFRLAVVLALVWIGASAASAQVPLTLDTPYTQNFDSPDGLANSGTSSQVPDNWAFSETGSSMNATYSAGTGSSNTGNTYSFGPADDDDRAFGGLLSGSVNPTIGASFQADEGFTALEISYTGEQWRLGAAGREDRLDFQYSTDATSLTTGTWVDVDDLDFIAPTTSGTVGARDGNDGANQSAVSFTITGLSIQADTTFWIRWRDFNADGADDGLGVDDFSITAFVGCEDTADCDDGFGCTTNACGEDARCVYTPEDTNCTDGFACTTDSCDPEDAGAEALTGCVYTPLDSNCGDSFACTVDACDPDAPGADADGCVYTADDELCADGATCTSESCQPGEPDADADGCVFVFDDVPCDDTFTCTEDLCQPDAEGADASTGCVNTTTEICDDGITCTLDSCDPTNPEADTDGCISTTDDASCEDTFSCTTNTCDPDDGGADADGCTVTNDDGACDDGASCTTESCLPGDDNADANGCVYDADDGPCADTFGCTIDSCMPGHEDANATTGCVNAANDVDCDDAIDCTIDTCDTSSADADAAGCVNARDDGFCSDAFGCTSNSCDPAGVDPDAAGCTIVFQHASCDDSRSCTDETCDPEAVGADGTTGCLYAYDHGDCDDGFGCTVDTCDPDAAGADGTTGCHLAKTDSLCADGFDCTTNTCDPGGTDPDADGCTIAFDDASCDDDVACTDDLCDPADPQADDTTGCLIEPDDGACASDGDVCTDEVCTLSGCDAVDNAAGCDDGNACTVGDKCSSGSCQAGPDLLECDDDKPCTDDTCSPTTGCVFNNNNGNSCSDDSLCTVGDFCQSGNCVSGTALACNDNNPCTTDSCQADTGCKYVNNTNACDDGSLTTHTDTCNGGGVCLGTTIVCQQPNQCQLAGIPNGTPSCPPINKTPDATCNDGLLTTKDDHCDGSGNCTGVTIVCPAPPQCQAPGTPNGSGCDTNYQPPGTACDDRKTTTTNDVCDGQGTCAGALIVCPTPTACQDPGVPDGVTCTPTNKPDDASCNDGDATTASDHCDGQGSCVGTPIECPPETECARYQPNGVDCTLVAKSGLCDDALDTTHSDVCIEGECRGTAYACAPAQCEATSVANGTDCTVTYKDDGAPCNDGNVNTRDDACDGGGACAGTPYTCTPGRCEASSMPDGEGCVATPALPGDPCDDLDGCTIDDVCDGAGECMGEAVECGDGEVCDDAGGCKLTHCVACAEDEECGANSLCVPLSSGTRCLVRCEDDLDCALNQVCRMHPSGTFYCFDHGGSCPAPGEDVEEEPEVVEEVEAVEAVEDEVEETEATSEEPGPDAAEEDAPVIEVVESGPADTQPDVGTEQDRRRGSDSDCAAAGGTSGLAWLASLALAVAALTRRRRRAA